MHKLFLTILAGAMLVSSCDNKKPAETTETTTTTTAKEDPVAKALKMSDHMDDLFNSGKWDEFAAGLAPDAVDHGMGMEIHGRDSIMAQIKAFAASTNGLKFKSLAKSSDGHYIFNHYEASGEMKPNAMGMKMKGGKFDYMGCEVIRLKDSLCVEHWDYADNAKFMQQVGMDMSAMMPPAEKKKK
jgi:predicted SnoaL-like aldol condensation-catalyzing enzyme